MLDDPLALVGTEASRRQLPRHKQRLLEAHATVSTGPRGGKDAEYLHALLTQLGLPRSRVAARTFERRSGTWSLRLEAGAVPIDGKWIEQPLPYGTRPRVILVHLCTMARATDSLEVNLGRSLTGFLRRLGYGDDSKTIESFRSQIRALAGCRLQASFPAEGRDGLINVTPIRMATWDFGSGARSGEVIVKLDAAWFESLKGTAVPGDMAALRALRHSAMAMDLYWFLCHRLCRADPAGELIRWRSLWHQLGTEYRQIDHFRNEVERTLVNVKVAYPQAKFDIVPEGMIVRRSPSPIAPRKLRKKENATNADHHRL